MLYFNCEEFILHAINNTADHVDRIYILYSPVPWEYDKEARKNIQNTSNLDILKKCAHFDKLKIIEGVYSTEEDQRNEGLEIARADGMDFLVIQDPDEFYFPKDFSDNLKAMANHPEAWYFRNPWYLFWKKKDYVIQFREAHGQNHTLINYNPVFALNCNSPVKFIRNRLVNTTDTIYLDRPCYHLSYYLSDNRLFEKINTWGHADQFRNKKKWYKYKWQAWDAKTKNLNPFNPLGWEKAVKFENEIPLEISLINGPKHEKYNMSTLERADEWVYDFKGFIYYYLCKLKTRLIRLI